MYRVHSVAVSDCVVFSHVRLGFVAMVSRDRFGGKVPVQFSVSGVTDIFLFYANFLSFQFTRCTCEDLAELMSTETKCHRAT